MINNFQKMLYRLTCVAPLMIISGIIIWIQKSNYGLSIVLIGSGVALCIYAVVFIKACIRKLAVIPIEVRTVAKSDISLYIYFVTYIVPLLGLWEEKTWYVVGVIGIVMIVLTLLIRQLSFSPILIFMRYHFYKIEISSGLGECYLLSKAKQMRDSGQIKYAIRLDDGLYIHWEENQHV